VFLFVRSVVTQLLAMNALAHVVLVLSSSVTCFFGDRFLNSVGRSAGFSLPVAVPVSALFDIHAPRSFFQVCHSTTHVHEHCRVCPFTCRITIARLTSS